MIDPTLTSIEHRLTRVERQSHILVGLLCAMAVVVSITTTHAASNIVIADEVRAHRFTLLDPRGGVADDWYIDDPNAPGASRRMLSGYSGWGYHEP